MMDNNEQQPRLWDTNPEYRERIRKAVKGHYESVDKRKDGDPQNNFGGLPLNDPANRIALAIDRDINDRRGMSLRIDEDDELEAEIADTIAETIRQGMETQNAYEAAGSNVVRLQPELRLAPSPLEGIVFYAKNNRSFKVLDPIRGNPNLAEFIEAFNDVINMTPGMKELKGMVSVLGYDYNFVEVTSEDQAQINNMVKAVTDFLENIPPEATAEEAADVMVKVRSGELGYTAAVSIVAGRVGARLHKAVYDEAEKFHDVADKWANKPGLTLAEACHGVAHDTFLIRTQAGDMKPLKGDQVDNSSAYGAVYDRRNVTSIKERKMRAAKELFGGQ